MAIFVHQFIVHFFHRTTILRDGFRPIISPAASDGAHLSESMTLLLPSKDGIIAATWRSAWTVVDVVVEKCVLLGVGNMVSFWHEDEI